MIITARQKAPNKACSGLGGMQGSKGLVINPPTYQ